MKKLSIIPFFALIQMYCTAQTEMLGSQYIFDKTFITPANFTQEDKFEAFMNYQSATGRERAGEEYVYSMSANFKANNDQNLVGINMVSARFGQENTLLGYVNYTFNLKLTETAVLSNGFGLGFQQYRLNLDDAQGVVGIDPALKGSIYSSKFDFRIGSTAVFDKKTYVGVSFDNVLSRYNNQVHNETDYLPVSFKRINITLMAGNRSRLDNIFDMSYEGFYNYNFGGASSIDLNAALVFSKLLSLGVAYRNFVRSEEKQVLSPNTVRPFIAMDISQNKNLMRFNYAYGFALNHTTSVGLSTHEFGLAYTLR